jgi:hypothetical protein
MSRKIAFGQEFDEIIYMCLVDKAYTCCMVTQREIKIVERDI